MAIISINDLVEECEGLQFRDPYTYNTLILINLEKGIFAHLGSSRETITSQYWEVSLDTSNVRSVYQVLDPIWNEIFILEAGTQYTQGTFLGQKKIYAELIDVHSELMTAWKPELTIRFLTPSGKIKQVNVLVDDIEKIEVLKDKDLIEILKYEFENEQLNVVKN